MVKTKSCSKGQGIISSLWVEMTVYLIRSPPSTVYDRSISQRSNVAWIWAYTHFLIHTLGWFSCVGALPIWASGTMVCAGIRTRSWIANGDWVLIHSSIWAALSRVSGNVVLGI